MVSKGGKILIAILSLVAILALFILVNAETTQIRLASGIYLGLIIIGGIFYLILSKR